MIKWTAPPMFGSLSPLRTRDEEPTIGAIRAVAEQLDRLNNILDSITWVQTSTTKGALNVEVRSK